MAPEQAAGDPATDHRADLHAWGVMAYELLAGRHPFADRTNPQALMAAQFAEQPTPLGTRAPGRGRAPRRTRRTGPAHRTAPSCAT